MRSDVQTNNIIKLINFLESLPENYPHFDMEDWYHPHDNLTFMCEGEQIRASRELGDPQVGSCGCALGHSLAAGIDHNGSDSWRDFAETAYGISGREFDMVFSGKLAFENNTPKAAARRLKAILPI